MFALEVERLPGVEVRRILVLRTAQTAQVGWAIERLRETYPGARFSVIGTQLEGNELFNDMERFELGSPWLTPRTFRPLARRIRAAGFDMVVMCLNSDCGAGYGRVSRVVRSIPARFKLVAGYNGRWYWWVHKNFEEGNVVVRTAVNLLGLAMYPVVAAWLLLKPSRPRYMPRGQGRRAPGYEA